MAAQPGSTATGGTQPVPKPPELGHTPGYWFLRIARELAAADRDIGFAGVLRLLMNFEEVYAYSAELAAGRDPEK